MDIRILTETGSFAVRAGALIFHEGKLLVASAKGDSDFYTIGGKVKIGETTQKAAIREAKEETGLDFSVDRLLFVQERFFNHQGKQHQEIAFFYLMQGDASSLSEGADTDQPGFETLHWLPVDQLHRYSLNPVFLQNALSSLPENPLHIISDER